MSDCTTHTCSCGAFDAEMPECDHEWKALLPAQPQVGSVSKYETCTKCHTAREIRPSPNHQLEPLSASNTYLL